MRNEEKNTPERNTERPNLPEPDSVTYQDAPAHSHQAIRLSNYVHSVRFAALYYL